MLPKIILHSRHKVVGLLESKSFELLMLLLLLLLGRTHPFSRDDKSGLAEFDSISDPLTR